jgi:hypothetical protein
LEKKASISCNFEYFKLFLVKHIRLALNSWHWDDFFILLYN